MVMAPSAIDNNQEYTSNTFDAFTGNVVKNHGNAFVKDNGFARRLVEHTLRDKVAEVDGDTCEADEEDTFFVADLGEVYRQHLRWKLNLPRVKPHYGKLQSSPSRLLYRC